MELGLFGVNTRRQEPQSDRAAYLELLQEMAMRRSRNKIKLYYPDAGPLRRELYPKHIAFMAAGSKYRERLMLAANRIGKTEAVGGYETVCHLTGRYPSWWEGRRFNHAVSCWAAGDTNITVRDILQKKYLGPPGAYGTGLIPADLIVGNPKSKPGIPDAVELVRVKHISGAVSVLSFKSYEQGRKSFEGTEQDVIHLDEEPPYPIYVECLLRTMISGGSDFDLSSGSKGGIILCTFTPLLGLSDTVMHFLPSGRLEESYDGPRFVIMATWDDAPHLTAEVKEELWSSIPVHQRDARTKGVPQLGAGAIYPIPEEEFTVSPFQLPLWWPRAYGMDVGWNRTACAWGAYDRDTDTLYINEEYYRGQAEPAIHASAIHLRGNWIPGVIDPAARGRNQTDGEKLLQVYQELGLDLTLADNAVEAGIYQVWSRLSTGRLKVFSTCQNWFTEYRVYRRDEKGRVVKKNDHLMDASRYLVMSGPQVWTTEPAEDDTYSAQENAWALGRSRIGGY